MIDFPIMIKEQEAPIETATVADLRNNFRRVSAWIENGQPVNITRHGVIFAQLTPPPATKKKPFKMPDFAAQRKKIWGNRRPFTMKEVEEMRAWELGEE
ncbi:MAG: hypothetical protein K2W99_07015 [Chthoniobacterales bacterium]|nr:hypothetical protein [Chthoniobacterales bacterium]